MQFTAGEALPQLPDAYAWTVGGTLDAPAVNAPPGYWCASSVVVEAEIWWDMQSAAAVPDCSQTVSVDAETWTTIKRLYRD